MVIGEVWGAVTTSVRGRTTAVVNAKRVYRVMRDHGLLLERKPAVPLAQQAIKGRVAVNGAIDAGARMALSFAAIMAKTPGHVRHGLL